VPEADKPGSALFLASNTLADIAFKAAKASVTDANSSLVALLFAAAWFEACLNEILFDLRERPNTFGNQDIADISLHAAAAGLDERIVSIERRLRVLCAACSNSELKASVQPWKGVLLLFRLRNWLIHLRPEPLVVREGREEEASSLVSIQVHQLAKDLLDAGAIKELPAGVLLPVSTVAQLEGVGIWAYRSAHAGILEVDKWFPGRHRSLAAFSGSPKDLTQVGAVIGAPNSE
jgi:hypothetical protein